MRLTEEYAHYYMPLIVLISGFVLFLHARHPTLHFSPHCQRALQLPLAGPSAMVAALASASAWGYLVKSVRFSRRPTRSTPLSLTRPGTLTTGSLAGGADRSCGTLPKRTRCSRLAARRSEAHSTHPLAQAVVNFARDSEVLIPDACDIVEEHGSGSLGQMLATALYLVGRRSWLAGKGMQLCRSIDEAPNLSAIFVALDEDILGRFVSPTAPQAEASVQSSARLREARGGTFYDVDRRQPGGGRRGCRRTGFTELRRTACRPKNGKPVRS